VTTLRARESTPIAFLGLLAYTVSVYTALGERLDFLAAIRHELLMGIVLIALSVKALMTDPIDFRPLRTLLIAIILLFVVLLSQIPFAYDPQRAWNTFFDYSLKHAMFTLFLVALVRSPRQLGWFMFTFMFSLFWVHQEAMVGLASGSLVWTNQGIQRLHGAVTLYRHPNGLSLIAVTALTFIVYLLPAVRRWYLKVALLGLTVMAALCIIYTGSRAGYVGTIAVVVFYWWFMPHKVKGTLALVAVAAAILTVLPQQYKQRFLSIGGQEAAGHSKEARILLMKDAWEIFKENPLGVGVNCFEPVRLDRYGRGQGTHNLYLQVLTNLGIQGFLVFFFFAGYLTWSFHRLVGRMQALRRATARLARGSPRGRRVLGPLRQMDRDAAFMTAVAKSGRLYLLMLLVNGMFAHTLYLICWWFAAGLAIVLAEMETGMQDEVRRRRRALLAAAEARAAEPV